MCVCVCVSKIETQPPAVIYISEHEAHFPCNMNHLTMAFCVEVPLILYAPSFCFLLLVVEPTHLKNMRKSNRIISPSFGVNIKHD